MVGEIIFSLFLGHSVLSGIAFAVRAQIKQYPNVTLSDCGIGQESQLMDDSCFVWHNTYQISQSSIKNGRDVSDGEMPFTVLIFTRKLTNGRLPSSVKCTGSVLNKNWVITAAHCVIDRPKLNETVFLVEVIPGARNYTVALKQTKFYAEQWISHPGYKFKEKDDKVVQDDIALIQLNQSIPLNSKGIYTNMNSVCLPKKGIHYDLTEEYALISGWGHIDDGKPNVASLKMGWNVVSDERNGTIKILYDTGKPADKHQALPCAGDSGGPLVQYVNGRAVLIGVFRGEDGGKETCPSEQTISFEFVSVSAKIDWIINTIRNNTIA